MNLVIKRGLAQRDHEKHVIKFQNIRDEGKILNTFRQRKAGHILRIRNQHGIGLFNSNHGF